MNQVATQTVEIMVAEPATATGLIGWAVAPEDSEQYHMWLDCQFKWLASLERRSGARNTRRAYERDVVTFFGAFAHYRLMPWDMTPGHAETYVEHLVQAGLSQATINRRVAALSSLYRYAGVEYIVPGSRQPLWPHPNPFGSRNLRYQISPYDRAVYPSADQVAALLCQIDLTTITGLRNLAILGGIFMTTRRVSEWLNLRWKDIHEGAEGRWFEYRYKGGKTKKQALPANAWLVIVLYLNKSGRLAGMQPDDPLFIAHDDSARLFRRSAGTGAQLAPDYDPATQPISVSYVNSLLKRYGRRVGIPDEKLHAHGLRHAGARWRKAHGASVWDLRDTLGHSSIAITQVYSDTALDEPADALGDTVGAILPKQLKLWGVSKGGS